MYKCRNLQYSRVQFESRYYCSRLLNKMRDFIMSLKFCTCNVNAIYENFKYCEEETLLT